MFTSYTFSSIAQAESQVVNGMNYALDVVVTSGTGASPSHLYFKVYTPADGNGAMGYSSLPSYSTTANPNFSTVVSASIPVPSNAPSPSLPEDANTKHKHKHLKSGKGTEGKGKHPAPTPSPKPTTAPAPAPADDPSGDLSTWGYGELRDKETTQLNPR